MENMTPLPEDHPKKLLGVFQQILRYNDSAITFCNINNPSHQYY